MKLGTWILLSVSLMTSVLVAWQSGLALLGLDEAAVLALSPEQRTAATQELGVEVKRTARAV